MSTNEPSTLQPFVYLDHNVLDDLIKSRVNDFNSWLITSPIIPVVSNTNLAEIARSSGYEDEFISLLDQINARFIEEIFDDRFRSTDRCRCYETNGDGLKAHMSLIPAEGDDAPTGFGGMVHKLLGGQPKTPFQEILGKGLEEIFLESESESNLEEDSKDDEQIKMLTSLSQIVAQGAMKQLGQLMDSETTKAENVKFQRYQESAPRVINNLEGDNLINKVISEARGEIDNIEYSAEDFLRQMDQISIETYGNGTTLGDKIRSLYILLSMFGYQREPKIKKDAGYRKDMRDIEHVVVARFCQIFFTKDKRLIKKAVQIYKYLNISTIVLHPLEFNKVTFVPPESRDSLDQ